MSGETTPNADVPKANASPLSNLVPALLDFEQMPGRYRLALREPQAVFEHVHAVLLLAVGRTVEGLPSLEPAFEASAVQRAARFFVRTVLLRPGADHYTLLGLAPDFEGDALRDHYRLMIRLTHPDFAASGESWPADAAARINIANDVLGSSVKRGLYDATLATTKPVAASAATMPVNTTFTAPRAPSRGPSKAAARGRRANASESWSQRSKIVLATGGALVCALTLWLMTPSEHEGSLVAQRGTAPTTTGAASYSANAEKTRLSIASNPLAKQAAEQLALADAGSSGLESNSTKAVEDVSLAKPLTNDRALVPAVEHVPIPSAETKAAAQTPALPRTQQRALAPAERRAASTEELETAQEAARQGRQLALAQATEAKAKKTAAAAPPKAAAPRATVSNSDSSNDNRLALSIDSRLTLPRLNTAEGNGVEALEVPNSPAPPGRAEPALTMAQVQPTLGKVIAGLQTGQGENVVRWLEGPWHEHPAAAAFVNRYEQLLAGDRVAELGKVSFRSRPERELLVVDGVIELRLQSADSETPRTKNLHISAYFLPKEGAPVFTRVVATQLR